MWKIPVFCLYTSNLFFWICHYFFLAYPSLLLWGPYFMQFVSFLLFVFKVRSSVEGWPLFPHSSPASLGISNTEQRDCFYGNGTWLSARTCSWSPRPGIPPPGARRFINPDREQSANALWCRSDWWQLCGRWRHADRYGWNSMFVASAGLAQNICFHHPDWLFYPDDNTGLLCDLLASANLA